MENTPKSEPVTALPKIRHHRLRWTIVVLIIILVLLSLAALGWSGVYQIPVISSIFGTTKPIDLGVHPTEADLVKAEADNPMVVSAEPGSFQWTRNKAFSGSVAIDDQHTSAEMTAFIKKYHGTTCHVRDIQVKFRNGGMEISAFVVPYIKAPAYVDVDVTRTSNQTISLNLKKAKVGRLTVPETYYDDIEKAAQDIINREIAKVPGFSIETLEYHAGTAYLKGALPQSVSLLPGEQSLKSLIED